jgi:Protein kinase domain
MGVVYRAYHAQLERVGAVKVLQGLAPDPDSAARFRREAQSIAHLRHPNIVNVFDFGEFEGTPYMIVEFVEGGSLSSVVKSGPLDRKLMLGYLDGIASALDYAHSRGIVHRDVKPANVLLGAENAPILADFGLAKLMESNSIKSLTGVTTGTPAYMAPEQVTASQVGPAADRYSLAVMAYEMLTGFLPFDQGGVLEVLYAQVHRVPDAPSSRSARLGAQVDAVIMRGLAKDPAVRWESCAAFVDALEKALDAKSKAAVEQTVVFAPPAPSTTPARKTWAADATTIVDTAGAVRGPDPVFALHPPRRRSKRGLAYAAVAVVALIVVLLVGTAAYFVATRPTTIDVSQTTVSAGDSVVVTASHVPRNQVGVFELHSVIRTYKFQADGNGNVRGTIFLPLDLSPGAHVLRICWNNTCHAETTLHVLAAVAITSPSASPQPGGSPTPVSPTVSAYPSSIVPGKTSIAVNGAHFTAGPGTLTVSQGSVSESVSVTIVSAGTFSKVIGISAQKSWSRGPATLKVCDSSSHCTQTTITIA